VSQVLNQTFSTCRSSPNHLRDDEDKEDDVADKNKNTCDNNDTQKEPQHQEQDQSYQQAREEHGQNKESEEVQQKVPHLDVDITLVSPSATFSASPILRDTKEKEVEDLQAQVQVIPSVWKNCGS